MGLRQNVRNSLYVPVVSGGDVSFQETNLNLNVKEVGRKDFLDNVFSDSDGFVCYFLKTEKVVRNTFYKYSSNEKKMYSYLDKTYGMNQYVSYSTYFKPKKSRKEEALRTQGNIVNTHLLVQDLDYYKYEMADSDFLRKLGELINSGKLLCPSYILSTGQGYQLIWVVEKFKNIAGYTNDRDWRNIQEHQYRMLEEFNPDNVVKNPSAVTRLPESKHRATGNKVAAYQLNEVVFTLQDFMMHYDIVPTPDRKVRPKKTKKIRESSVSKVRPLWNEYSLNILRCKDIFIYVRECNERHQSYVGIRNWLSLILRFHSLVATDGDEEYAIDQVRSLCDEMDLSGTSEEEILRRSAPAERYYEEWIMDTWDKQKYLRGGLFYTNKRMIELMGIEKDYYLQWKMNTIKIRNKPYERARKRFEKFGYEKANEHTWEAYQERRNKRLEQEKESKLWSLEKAISRYPNATQKQLAEYLGVSQKTISKWKSQME